MAERAVPPPTMPDSVYHRAAVEWDRRSAKPASGDIVAPLRAAVESAWRAGYAARTTDECDDKVTGIPGQPNLFCERPLGHRGWHQSGETKWRFTDDNDHHQPHERTTP